MLCWLSHLHLILYLVISLYYALKDSLHSGNKVKQRIAQGPVASLARYMEVLPAVCINLFFNILLIEGYNAYLTPGFQLNSWFFIPLGFFITLFLNDAWFYLWHRYFHYNRWLYQHYHKQHHIYSEPFAFSALDNKLFEHLWINVGSIALGPLLAGYWGFFNNTMLQFWLLLVTCNVVVAHSGYSKLHYYHHKLIHKNYGQGLYFLDYCCSTFYSGEDEGENSGVEAGSCWKNNIKK